MKFIVSFFHEVMFTAAHANTHKHILPRFQRLPRATELGPEKTFPSQRHNKPADGLFSLWAPGHSQVSIYFLRVISILLAT